MTARKAIFYLSSVLALPCALWVLSNLVWVLTGVDFLAWDTARQLVAARLAALGIFLGVFAWLMIEVKGGSDAAL